MTETNIESPQNWYFTFLTSGEYANNYAVFYGTYNSTRDQMMDKFGTAWGFQYPSAEAAGVYDYNLTEVK